MNYFNDVRLRTLLRELIELSALPLAQIENDSFSVDSSGFSTSKFGRWFDFKFNEEKERREYKKAHIMIGNKTNVVTSVTITDKHGADSPQLAYLVKKTALNFNMKEVCADKAYISRKNLETIFQQGAFPFIPFKEGTTALHNGALWRHMYQYFKDRPQDFYEHYHKRSNVETSFFMIKQKFNSDLMTKNDLANVNEIFCKLISHNLCCLIHAFYEFNLERTLWTEQTNPQKIQVLA
jgi:transposase